MPFSHDITLWYELNIHSVLWWTLLLLSKFGSASNILSFALLLMSWKFSKSSVNVKVFFASVISSGTSLFFSSKLNVSYMSTHSLSYFPLAAHLDSQAAVVSTFPWSSSFSWNSIYICFKIHFQHYHFHCSVACSFLLAHSFFSLSIFVRLRNWKKTNKLEFHLQELYQIVTVNIRE